MGPHGPPEGGTGYTLTFDSIPTSRTPKRQGLCRQFAHMWPPKTAWGDVSSFDLVHAFDMPPTLQVVQLLLIICLCFGDPKDDEGCVAILPIFGPQGW